MYIGIHICIFTYLSICMYICKYIHTPIYVGKKAFTLSGKKAPFEGNKSSNFFASAAGETPDPCHLSGPARDDIKHLQTLNTFRHQTPMLAGGRRRRHGTHAPRSHTQTGPAARTKSLYPSVGTRNESHSAFVKESSWHSAADSEELVSSWPLLGLSD